MFWGGAHVQRRTPHTPLSTLSSPLPLLLSPSRPPSRPYTRKHAPLLAWVSLCLFPFSPFALVHMYHHRRSSRLVRVTRVRPQTQNTPNTLLKHTPIPAAAPAQPRLCCACGIRCGALGVASWGEGQRPTAQRASFVVAALSARRLVAHIHHHRHQPTQQQAQTGVCAQNDDCTHITASAFLGSL